MDQRPAGIVADASEHRGADTRRANHRVRITPNRMQSILELIECRARQAHNLLPLVDEMNTGETHGVDQDDAAIVVIAVRGRSTRQTCIRRLHDHDFFGGDNDFQYPPLFDERARADDSDDRTTSEAETCAKTPGPLRTCNDVGPPDNLLEGFDQRSVIYEARTAIASGGRFRAQLNMRIYGLGPLIRRRSRATPVALAFSLR